MDLKKNQLKELISTGQLALGTHIDTYSPTLIEIAGLAGFDYVYIEAEHAPLNWETFEHLVRAAELSCLTPLVRLDEEPLNRLVRKALEAGVEGVIIPHISSVEEAKAAVQAVKFPPDGVRGMGTMRARRYGTIPLVDYLEWSNHESLVIILIEEKAAVEKIEEILSVKGIDVVVFGADRIAANGDVANKIGSYSLAVSAKYHEIPCYCAAPLSTFDINLKNGKEIPIENRDPNEILNIYNYKEKNLNVYNPAFDVTPFGFFSGIITEAGIIKSPIDKNINNFIN